MTWLVLGYGNELRGDDAVGPLAARQVEAWHLPEVRVTVTHGLTPELAELLAGFDRAIFIDAAVGTEDAVQLVELVPTAPARMGHTSDPGWLLSLCEQLFDRRPRAWLLTLPAERFDHGAELSLLARRSLTEALARLQELLATA